MFVDPIPVLHDLSENHGSVIGLGAGPLSLAIVGDPLAIREMFGLPAKNFRWGHKFNVLGFVVGDESMIVSDGEEHHRRRSAVQGAFSRRQLNGWIPMILQRTDQVIDRQPSATSIVDLYRLGRSLVLEIVCEALFGSRLAARASEIGDLFQRPQDYLEAPAFKQAPHPFPRTARSRVRSDRKAMDEIIDAEIARLRANPYGESDNVLATLVSEGSLSDGEMRDQVVTLIGAGYDTTSASLAWMIWRICLDPELGARLRTEADEVFGIPGTPTNADANTLASLDLANRTMRETTRLHPAGVISPRETAQDVSIGGFRIPKGTLILWSAYLAGRDPKFWENPLCFNPDRFIDLSDEQAELAKLAWGPFGGGARNCIGFALAQMELTLIVSRLFQRLDLTAMGAEIPTPVGMVVNRPAGGAHMQVAHRV